MKIIKYNKEEACRLLKGEECQSFLEDIEKLNLNRLKQLKNIAYVVMQLKRFSREEIKTLLGYTMKLIDEKKT